MTIPGNGRWGGIQDSGDRGRRLAEVVLRKLIDAGQGAGRPILSTPEGTDDPDGARRLSIDASVELTEEETHYVNHLVGPGD